MISLNLRHPLGKATTLLFFLFSAILWTSCDKEQALSSENLIVSLSLKDGDKEYAAKVSSGTLSVELPSGSTLPTEVTISLLELSPQARASTSANSKLTLAGGRATITVTAENKATKQYTLIVTVKKSAAADLKSLSVSIGSKNYTATLSNSQASVLLPASVVLPAFVTVASLEVSDLARASVAVGGRIDLTNGAASIVVTAEDGTTTRSYTLEVSKEEGNQAALNSLIVSTGGNSYTATLSNSQASVVLPVTVDIPTFLTVEAIGLSDEAMASVVVGGRIDLTNGTGSIVVTAEDGTTTRSYTLKVSKEEANQAALNSLIVSTGGNSYTATLSNSQASVVLPASVAIPAFVTVASFEVSDLARASVVVGGRIDLTNGTGSIVVTAEDGTTTRSYTLKVSKEEANQANLFALSIRFGETVYEATISGDVATFSGVSRSMTSGTITVIDISEGARSSVIVDGVLSFTGGEGQLTVTASDGQTSKTIIVNLEGAALSTEAELSALSLMINDVTYTAVISGTVVTVLIPQVVTSASVASLAYATGATSSVQQGGALTFTGGVSTITITAADGKTTKTYQITLAKEGDFLTSFSFQAADNSYTSPYTAFATSLGEIDQTTGMVEVELSPYLRGVELASLVPSFTTIGGATVVVGTVAQESGKTPNNFESDVVYTLSLAGTTKQYTVSVVLSNLAWIPDPNFRAKLKDVQSLALAFTQNDSLITDHSSVTGLSEMNVAFSSISSMMGLEFFTGLTHLDCKSNDLTSLDVSANTALTNFNCTGNRLMVLDVSQNTALTSLNCDINQLTALDVSQNTALTNLNCDLNLLTSLDVRTNIALTGLSCQANQLTSLDVRTNTALTILRFGSNLLTDLDVRINTGLTTLYCGSNQLTTVDLLANTMLEVFYCDSNQLEKLDLRTQKQLLNRISFGAGETVDGVVKNPLTNLHMFENFKDYAAVLEAKQNLGGAVTISTYNTAGDVVCEDYDPIGQICTDGFLLTSFSIDLASNTIVTSFAGRTNLVGQIDHESDPKTVTVFVSPYEKEVDFTSLKASFEVKSSATVTVGGVGQTSGTRPNNFSAPVSYSVSSGAVTQQYTVSVKETNLAWIPDANFRGYLKGALPQAAFTQNDSLITDHSSVTGLSEMRVAMSNIGSMTGLEFFTGLTNLDCNSNQLTALDVSKNIALTALRCYSNSLTAVDVTKNIALTTLDCGSNQLTAVDLSKNTELRNLRCHSNQLTAVDLSKNTELRNLRCHSNQLTAVDLSKNTELRNLYCGSNQLTTLDLLANTMLQTFDCDTNQLTSLNLRAQQSWTTLSINAGVTANDVVQNPLTTLHVHEDVKDNAEFVEAKTNRVNALTISTYNTAGGVVCEDYDPIGQNCTDGFFLKSFSIDLASNNMVTSFAGRTRLVGQIDYESATRTVTVFVSPYEEEVDLTSLKASFEVKSGATVTVGGVAQTSGTTPNSFSTPVIYRVSSGSNTQQYTVSVKETNLAWIPDANFRAKLKTLSLAGAFTQNDSLITDHGSVTGLNSIVVVSSSISSMMGIEFFTGLTTLYCYENQLTSLDVSQNTALTYLSCHSNDLTSLDVSQNTALAELYCFSNELTDLDVSQNTALTELYCHSSELTDLDVSQNTALTELYCHSSELTDLDVSKNIALISLDCSSNQLTALDVTKNTALTDLNCSSNQLTALDLRAQQSWTTLSINAGETTDGVVKNPLTTLHVHEDVKDNAEFVEAKTNRVDALTISTYTTAGGVVCADYNPITTTCDYPLTSFSIDLASNTIVTSFADRTNLVGQIDQQAKTVTVLISPYEKGVDLTSLKASFEVKSGATVTVGEVTQISGVTPNNFSAPVTYSVSSGSTTQEYTVSVKETNLAWIPDANFRAKLKDLLPEAAFTQNDSLTTDHSSVTGLTNMRVDNSNIASMTGLEFFTGLTDFNCYDNLLTSLDVSKNIGLTKLYCFSNDLTSLDVSKNIALINFSCNSNDLTSLDVSKNIALTELRCNSNLLTDLDVSKNIALTEVYCSSNLLTDLDVSKNIGLAQLYCSSNLLTNLDLRAQQSWSYFSINAGVTATDVVQNPLTTLHVHEAVKDHAEVIEAKTNRGDALTISTYTTAGDVVCEDYDPIAQSCKDGFFLKSFSIDLASNTIVTTHTGRTRLVGQIDHESDPKTVTVFVSPYEKNVDLTSLKASFGVKSGATVTVGGVAQISGVTPNNFSTPVTYSISSGSTTQEYTVSVKTTNLAWIPDANFRAKLKGIPSLAVAFTQNDSLITDHGSVTGLTEMDVESSSIRSMMGLEFFTALTILSCYENLLTSLDVSKNTALTILSCPYNDLTSLDVSKNTALIVLSCSSNQLRSLDVTLNTALTKLSCSDNQLTALDVSQNIALTKLSCSDNQLTVLDVSKNTGLTELGCYSNQLTSLDLRAQQSWYYFIINAGVTVDGVVQNPLTTLHIHEAFKDHEEVIEAKTNRGDALTISTYTTAGGVACNNYDPRETSRGCKD